MACLRVALTRFQRSITAHCIQLDRKHSRQDRAAASTARTSSPRLRSVAAPPSSSSGGYAVPHYNDLEPAVKPSRAVS